VDAAYKLHCSLGSGLLESVYETVLARDLERRGLRAARQVSVSFEYDRLIFEDAYRVDLMIENLVIVEVKSLECLHAVHAKQLLTYRRLLKLPVGLLINFGGATFKEGVQRVVNGLAPSASPRLCVNQMPETSTGL
jgi:iron complex transport system substrate-binding protein